MSDERRLPSAKELNFSLSNIPRTRPDNALTVQNSGEIVVGGYVITPKGLVIRGDVTEQNWREVGSIIFKLDGAIQWLIGDYLVSGERQWGKTVERLAAELGRTKGTLYNCYYVANQVKISCRNETLSFYHHYAVAKETPEMQTYWLGMAEQNGWSVKQLRDVMRGSPAPSDAGFTSYDVERKLTEFRTYMMKKLDGVGQEDRQAIAKMLRKMAREIEES